MSLKKKGALHNEEIYLIECIFRVKKNDMA